VSLGEYLRRRTIYLLLKLGLLTQQFAKTLPYRENSGFSVDNPVRLDGGDRKVRQALAQYIARALLSLQKLTYYHADPIPHQPAIPTISRRSRGRPQTGEEMKCDSECDTEREHTGLHRDIEGHGLLDLCPSPIYK